MVIDESVRFREGDEVHVMELSFLTSVCVHNAFKLGSGGLPYDLLANCGCVGGAGAVGAAAAGACIIVGMIGLGISASIYVEKFLRS